MTLWFRRKPNLLPFPPHSTMANVAAGPFRFASFSIVNQVFFQSSLSLGLVNLKPLVPGRELDVRIQTSCMTNDTHLSHLSTDVLVIPKRVVPRFRDLTPAEVADLFASTHQISKVIEQEYEAQSVALKENQGRLQTHTSTLSLPTAHSISRFKTEWRQVRACRTFTFT